MFDKQALFYSDKQNTNQSNGIKVETNTLFWL